MARQPFNRAARRALLKAARCIDATTKIPAGVRAKLQIFDDGLLPRIAAKHGKLIGGSGCVTLRPSDPETETASEAETPAEPVAQAA